MLQATEAKAHSCFCSVLISSFLGKTNFFEKKVSEYQLAAESGAFSTEEDF